VKEKKRRSIWRKGRRDWKGLFWFLPAVALLGIFGTGIAVLYSQAERQNADRLRENAGKLQALVDEAQAATDKLVASRREEIRQLEEKLKSEASALSGDIQIVIQNAVTEYRNGVVGWHDQSREALAEFKWLDGVSPSEYSRPEEQSDWPEKVLLGCGPTLLKKLLPGQTLTVLESGQRPILHLNGGEAAGNSVAQAAERQFLFQAAGENRLWKIRVSAAESPKNPCLDEKFLAETLAATATAEKFSSGMFRGIVFDQEGNPACTFPRGAQSVKDAPLPAKENDWLAPDENGEYLTRLVAAKEGEWRVGGQITFRNYSPTEQAWRIFREDKAWPLGLGSTLFLALAGMAAAYFRQPPPAIAPEEQRGAEIRLVKKEGAREFSENPQVLMAEIPDRSAAPTPRIRRRVKSLKVLQQVHRGSSLKEGSRILDHARSPILKELAGKVRPPEKEKADAVAARDLRAAREKIGSFRASNG
jgi:hypothetical protein